MENVKTFKAILRTFELASGLKINFAKSCFGAFGESDLWKQQAANYLNCRLLVLPFTYLGIPIGANLRRCHMWDPIIHKCERKLAKWKQRHISFGGRVTLIQSVLTSIPIYFFSFFRVPKSVVDKLVRIQRRFLWGGGPDQNKIAWISWEAVCLPKKKGGLGIKDINNFNMALLGKWESNLRQHKGELWAKVLESKYGGWRGLAEVDRVGHKSIWWRDLQKALTSSHQGQLIQKGMKWKVGSGDQIKFWEDKWTGEEESLAEKYPRLYLISLQQHQVIRLMGMYKDIGWEWNFTWRRSLFENEIDSAVNFLSDIADKSIQQQGPDAWVWSEDPAAQYSTRNAYNMLGEEGAAGRQEECFEKLWRIRIPARIAVFAWRLIRDRLPTRQNLRRRQVQITDMLCPFCRIQEEGASHLFFHCNKIQPIWWDTMSWLHIKGAFPLSPKQHFLQHLGVQVDGVRTNRWQYWWLALTWSIWKLRNSIVFSNATFNANSLFEDATFLLWSWLRSFKKDFTVHFNQ